MMPTANTTGRDFGPKRTSMALPREVMAAVSHNVAGGALNVPVAVIASTIASNPRHKEKFTNGKKKSIAARASAEIGSARNGRRPTKYRRLGSKAQTRSVY